MANIIFISRQPDLDGVLTVIVASSTTAARRVYRDAHAPHYHRLSTNEKFLLLCPQVGQFPDDYPMEPGVYFLTTARSGSEAK